MKKKREKKVIIKSVLYIVIVFVLFTLITLINFGLDWAEKTYGTVPFSQLVFHLKVPLKGTSNTITGDFIHKYFRNNILFLIITLISLCLFTITHMQNREKFILKNKSDKYIDIGKILKIFIFLCVVTSLGYEVADASERLGIREYVKLMNKKSTIYEKYYVDASKVSITAPEKKKNLIYIYCESLEKTFLSTEYGGNMANNLMPNLTCIAINGENFSGLSDDADYVNGPYCAYNTEWTIAGMVAQSSGISLNIPIDGNSYGEYSKFLPGVTSLGDILKKSGYSQELLVGSDAAFGGRKNYFSQHGKYKIFDLSIAKKEGYIDEDYSVNWGFEDEKLFEYAKYEIMELASENKPFNFTMLTSDTHFPEGYVCDLCGDEFDTQYENVISCSDRQIYDFVLWLKNQDFYEDTVVVISGDHTSMSTAVKELEVNDDYNRKVFSVVINSDLEYYGYMERQFTTMDLFPTTLASMGFVIEGDRLGLGTNLYSDKQTLTEEMGIDKLNDELSKVSDYYNKNILR